MTACPGEMAFARLGFRSQGMLVGPCPVCGQEVPIYTLHDDTKLFGTLMAHEDEPTSPH